MTATHRLVKNYEHCDVYEVGPNRWSVERKGEAIFTHHNFKTVCAEAAALDSKINTLREYRPHRVAGIMEPIALPLSYADRG